MNWRMNTGEWLKTKKANREKTILVVDDEAFLVDILYEILGSHGYTVLTATSGEEAVQVAKKSRSVDFLLTDLLMKPVNGPQLAEELKKDYPLMKVLFMSGYEPDYVRYTLGLHNIDFLVKPISAQVLLEKIAELFGSSTSASKLY